MPLEESALNPMPADFLIYGSYGYTGDLIARGAARQDMKPLLAGRNPDKLDAQAQDLKLEKRAFSLDESAKLAAALNEVQVVLNCAGPFSHTADRIVAGCSRR